MHSNVLFLLAYDWCLGYNDCRGENMVTIKQIHSKKDFKKFVDFSLKLYKDCPNYVPPLYSDEINLTNPKKNASFDDTDAAYFLAYDEDGVIVGRTAGLICHLFNEKNNVKYARFTRFECIDNEEVAHELLQVVENWAKANGMEYVHGPLGFNDLEREGLMVEGFEHMGEYQTSYNLPYYQKYIESYGYTPDAKWVEWRVYTPEDVPERVKKVAEVVQKRYGFYEKKFKNKKEVIKNYGREFFKVLDEAFVDIYGTMPFSKKLVDQTIDLFNLVLDLDYISLIFNKNDEMIGFGLGYPSLAKSLRKCDGKLFPWGWIPVLHDIKHPKVVELGIIAVKPEYQKMGVTAVIINSMMERLIKNKIEYTEFGLQLETNTAVLSAFDMFDRKLMRRKTCYIKKL